jgi:hypothetical protein
LHSPSKDYSPTTTLDILPAFLQMNQMKQSATKTKMRSSIRAGEQQVLTEEKDDTRSGVERTVASAKLNQRSNHQISTTKKRTKEQVSA